MIKALLLDLDNTLYPESAELDKEFSRRIKAFVADFLGVSVEEAAALRERNLLRFGTTLEWLKKDCGLADEDVFFSAIHPECEAAEVPEDPALRPFLLSLNLPLILLTNSPRIHAERILKRLNVLDLFSCVYDLTWNGGIGKPSPSSFINSLSDAGFTPKDALFVDDNIRYVLGYREVGGIPVLVDERGKHSDFAQKEGIAAIRSIYELPSTGLL